MRFAHFQFDPETDRLGEGPLSEVYMAQDLELGRTVALKILRAHAEIDPQADLRFMREAQRTSNLNHKHITTIYEYAECDGTSFIAMEYLEGQTLDKIIKSQSLGYEECVRIALQLTEALRVVHDAQLIHRDLKPGNILLQEDGNLKLLDFGIARARNETGITQQGMLVGTVLYMSPEQVRGEELDYRSDIFSLGAVLYHVMTGALPFPGESFPEVCMAILDGKKRRPSEVRPGFPQPLEDFLLKCLEPRSEARFADAEEAHGALATVAHRLTGTSTTRPSALRGTLLLTEVQCGGPNPESCHIMAGGVRRDLQVELARNKGLNVILAEPQDEDLPPFEYVITINLSAVTGSATLELCTGFYEPGESAPVRTRQVEDTVTAEDENEWALQEKLVRNAMRAIRRRLTEKPVRIDTSRDRKVEEALSLTAIARGKLRKGTTKHLLAATSTLRRALDLDRFCAPAYAALAEALVRKYLTWDGDPTFLDEARDNAAKALSLDARCAAAHTALGFANHVSGHTEDAQREYRLAMQLDDHEWMAHRLLGAIYAREGNFKGASPLLVRAIGQCPEHIASYDHLYVVLRRLNRYEEAGEYADQGIDVARRYLAKTPDDMDARVHMALLYARLGSADKARQAIEDARRRAPKDGYTAFHAACVYALLGDPLEAVACLKLSQARGYFIKSELTRNTDLDILHGLPEFQELAR